MLHLDYNVPIAQLREKAREFVEADPLWDKEAFAVQVVDTLPTCIQVRVLVSANDAPSTFDLRCNIREKLIEYLKTEHPGSLPLSRIQFSETTSTWPSPS